MSKLTLEEKRLQQLRMQLFGKERQAPKTGQTSSQEQTNIKKATTTPVVSSIFQNSSNLGEARFLKQDITKVFVLSSIAVGGQFLLYYLSLQGIVNLNVFHVF